MVCQSLISILLKRLIVIGIIISCTNLAAQRNTTQGLPWTYVVKDSIPSYALDTAQERVLYETDTSVIKAEIRYVYRINFHPHLVKFLAGDSMFIEVPTNPGDSRLVKIGGAGTSFGDSLTGDNFLLSGYGSRTSPELGDISLSLSARYHAGTSDSIYQGTLAFAPGPYLFAWNGRYTDFDRYCYLVQLTDPVYYPDVVSTEEFPLRFEVSAYPNPATDRFSVELPEEWAVDRLTLRLYDPVGKLLYRRRVAAAKEQHVSIPADAPAGLYTATLHRLGGEHAVARVMKQ